MQSNIIINLCIFHYEDSFTSTYLGYIGNSLKIKDKNNQFSYMCKKNMKFDTKWYLYKNFYAFTPILRPIPFGMKLFKARNIKSFPYNTTEVSLVYDPYKIEDDCIYFLAYNQPVPNTKPLYLHKTNKNIYPSFDKNPPNNGDKWVKSDLSPIYVMDSDNFGENTNDILFNCINGRCIPYKEDENNKNIWDYSNPVSFNECFTKCNVLNFDLSDNIILPYLSKHVSTPYNLFKIKEKHFTGLIIFLIIFLLVIIILIMFRK